jgi:hypothetical protein
LLPSDLVAFLDDGLELCATARSGVFDLVLEEGTLYVGSAGVDDLDIVALLAYSGRREALVEWRW